MRAMGVRREITMDIKQAALFCMFVTLVTSNAVLTNGQGQAEPQTFTVPKFCNNLACPAFMVISSTSEYEVREYAETEWVSTNQTNMDGYRYNYNMFMRLFGYIKGENGADQPISMTCPVVKRINLSRGPTMSTMSFFVDPKQSPAPEPINPNVGLYTVPSFTAYVRQFGGFTRGKKVWQDQADLLGNALKRDGLEFREDIFWTAGYDSPWKSQNRHNEVWFLPKNGNLPL
ncbi:heme-binding protein 2-like isoform X1 [Mya arenaria]|uniref:heme-binding protein 2-like isoform X1 n=1 Tax=Mya arenaria TaxID=6604 RepID=UPI0022E6B253|nr:heme-binding protein 2-like isoform X1 [Mya arenaria]